MKEKNTIGAAGRFSNATPGVAGLVLSDSGVPYVGKRTNKERQGSLNATAGHLAYREDVSKVDLHVDLYREMFEEFGVLPSDVKTIRFVGAYENPLRGDFDFTFVVETNLPDSYFASEGAWHQRRVSEEHEELIALATPEDVQILLEEGRVQERKQERFNVMYSTRGALESLAAGF